VGGVKGPEREQGFRRMDSVCINGVEATELDADFAMCVMKTTLVAKTK
jgi:hypothetical protein